MAFTGAPPFGSPGAQNHSVHRVPPGSCTSSQGVEQKYMRRSSSQRDDQRDGSDPLDHHDHQQHQHSRRAGSRAASMSNAQTTSTSHTRTARLCAGATTRVSAPRRCAPSAPQPHRGQREAQTDQAERQQYGKVAGPGSPFGPDASSVELCTAATRRRGDHQTEDHVDPAGHPVSRCLVAVGRPLSAAPTTRWMVDLAFSSDVASVRRSMS